MNNYSNNSKKYSNRHGIVLLVTLVVLVILSMLGYTLSSHVMSQRLRNQYLIDYTKARYGCDSAMKYAFATLEGINPVLVERPDDPDFSDLYALDSSLYNEMIKQWTLEYKAREKEKYLNADTDENNFSTSSVSDNNDADIEENETISIPGPYGAPWPLITEPVEIEIGTAKVKIEIEDENAKYPLGWAMIDDGKIQREIDAGFETFCEMAGLKSDQIDTLKSDVYDIRTIRPFKINFEPVITTKRQTTQLSGSAISGTKTGSTSTPQVIRSVLTVATQISNQSTSLVRLFNSSLLDREMLARPTIVDDNRKESPLKYISTWGTRQVNINTAPRHVLEAAFIFGGNQVKITEQVIEQRKIKPFENIEDLQKRIIGFTDSIEKCKVYITTASDIFTIRITATSGIAKASAVIAVTKDGGGVRRIATING
jgi:hypothetical protein